MAGFFLALLIIAALGVYSYLSIQQLIETANALSRSLRVTNLAERVLVTTIDLETGQRGFVITGDTRYLEPYKSAKQSIDSSIELLLDVTEDQPSQHEMVKELRNWTRKKSEIVEMTVAVRRKSFDSAVSLVNSGRGKLVMDTIRSIIADIQQHESYAFSRQSELTSGRVLREFQYSFIGLLLVPAVIIVVLFYNINRNLNIRDRTEMRLNRATTEATALNKELESFTYSVSHDLRAPLRSVNSYAEILREDYGDQLDENARKYIDVIIRNGKRMGQLVDDLLDFSRLGRREITKVKVDVDQLVRDVVAGLIEINPQASRAEVAIGKLGIVEGDASMLKQVWTNLLSNAFKYSSKRDSPKIEIDCREDGRDVVYCIQDNGVGFKMEYVHKLFNVFQRLHKMEEFEGTGVGLALVKRIVNRHGGRIWVEAEIDQGAKFYFSLPKRQI